MLEFNFAVMSAALHTDLVSCFVQFMLQSGAH